MASSRDDFIIAIRSAFLKKSTQQKFSLLTLVFLSIFIIVLSSFNIKPVQKLKIVINEIVYRSSFIVSIPENFLVSSFLNIKEYSNFYGIFKKNQNELEKLKSNVILNEIIVSENKELKNLIEDYTLTTNKILAKVIVDHKSPFLKTIVINKGSADRIKIGTNIYDKSYLVGRVIELNFKTSRVLLLSDLNSSVPTSIVPGDIQAIVSGTGKNLGEIKYIKDNLISKFQNESIVYTSGTGSIFKSGIPVGKIAITDNKIGVDFFSDFTQLKYVFAEVEEEIILSNNINKQSSIEPDSSKEILEKEKVTEKIKLDLLNEQIGIMRESNLKFIDENQKMKADINILSEKILSLEKENIEYKDLIKQDQTDQEELEFLRLNLLYSNKCQSKKLFSTGYNVGTEEYRECIMRRGKKERRKKND